MIYVTPINSNHQIGGWKCRLQGLHSFFSCFPCFRGRPWVGMATLTAQYKSLTVLER